jgi:hypothetical protein
MPMDTEGNSPTTVTMVSQRVDAKPADKVRRKPVYSRGFSSLASMVKLRMPSLKLDVMLAWICMALSIISCSAIGMKATNLLEFFVLFFVF